MWGGGGGQGACNATDQARNPGCSACSDSDSGSLLCLRPPVLPPHSVLECSHRLLHPFTSCPPPTTRLYSLRRLPAQHSGAALWPCCLPLPVCNYLGQLRALHGQPCGESSSLSGTKPLCLTMGLCGCVAGPAVKSRGLSASCLGPKPPGLILRLMVGPGVAGARRAPTHRAPLLPA